MERFRLSREEKVLIASIVLDNTITVLTGHLLRILEGLLPG